MNPEKQADAFQSVRIYAYATLRPKMVERIRAGSMEAACAWTLCRDLHRAAREKQTRWPGRDELQKAVKGRFALHSQSAQMVTHAFLAAVETARENRAAGNRKARYPYRDKRFYPLLWPAQAMKVEAAHIILPMGRGRKSIVLPRPADFVPGAAKLVWNGAHYELHVTIEAPVAAPVVGEKTATIDLGQIHQVALVTSEGEALIVSGRGIRSEKRRQNKSHGEFARLLSRCQRGSRRWHKLTHARANYAARSERRVRDLAHKGTRMAIDYAKEKGVARLFIGNPDGVRKKRAGRHHNQRMSQWEYGRDIDYLEDKAQRAGITSFTGSERGTSSRCPCCGHRQKPKGRVWRCRACGFIGHRDLVGSTNMHPLAFDQTVRFPSLCDTTYRRPGPASRAGRAAGHEYPAAGSRRRPGTGHRQDARPLAPVLLSEREDALVASVCTGSAFAPTCQGPEAAHAARLAERELTAQGPWPKPETHPL